MALMITDHCINCGYCMKECPNQAIYEPGMRWNMMEGTDLEGSLVLNNGLKVEASELLAPLSDQYYFIIPDKCAECKGVYDTPQCLEVCPDPESLVVDPIYHENEYELILKQARLNHFKQIPSA